MKRKGISLIVLIITIVVIIILATAIIVSLAKTNIITNANESVMKNDLATAQDAYNLYILDKEVQVKKNLIGKGRIASNAANTTFSYKEESQSNKEYKQTNITLADIGINSDKIDSIIIDNDIVTGIQVSSKCYNIVNGRYVEITSEEYEENSIVLPENSSLVGRASKIKESGITQLSVTGIADGVEENKSYSVDAIVYNGNLVLDGSTLVEGATLENNIYEFGNSSTDVATSTTDAQNMVVLKVNGNLTINEGVTLTACKSADGYGGPKGMLIYCTGTVTNNGTISMTARGARAVGENVYLWQNEDESFEYVPAIGANGGAVPTLTTSNGNAGSSATIARQTAGGGSGAKQYYNSGAGGTGTSYSGGTGGGANCQTGYSTSAGSDIGGIGGKAAAGNSASSESASGGTGNPGGYGASGSKVTGHVTSNSFGVGVFYNSNYNGNNGTGGLLVIYADTLVNNGEINSNGTDGKAAWTGGGASGAGSINIFYYQNYSNNGDITVNGGIGNAKSSHSSYNKGGDGGTGSISVGCVESGTYVSAYKNY